MLLEKEAPIYSTVKLFSILAMSDLIPILGPRKNREEPAFYLIDIRKSGFKGDQP
jgi:hypothetical protein